MGNEIEKSGLVSFLETKNISEETALSIAPSFEDFYVQANDWKSKATAFLKDPNISDEEKAKQARIARLALVKVRTGIDKKRKELNADDKQRIDDRNQAAGVLSDLVTPLEDLLLEKEKAQEIAQKAINDKIKEDREAKLAPYSVDSTFYDLINMPEELFEKMLENSKLAHEAKIQKEKEAEEQAAFEKRTSERKEQLVLIGFKPHETGAYVHKLFDVHEEIVDYPNDQWESFLNKLKADIDADKKQEEEKANLRAEEAEKEAARLKAEKDELKRIEEAKEVKHKAAIARQEILSELGCTLDYNSCAEMDEKTWTEFEQIKRSEYQAEQLKLHKEKKQKEIKEARVQSRINELQKLDFYFDEKTLSWKRDDIEALILITTMETSDNDIWINDVMAGVAGKIYDKREAKLAPDKTKIHNVINKMEMPAISTFEFKSGETEALYATIQAKFDAFKKWANEQVNTLK